MSDPKSNPNPKRKPYTGTIDFQPPSKAVPPTAEELRFRSWDDWEDTAWHQNFGRVLHILRWWWHDNRKAALSHYRNAYYRDQEFNMVVLNEVDAKLYHVVIEACQLDVVEIDLWLCFRWNRMMRTWAPIAERETEITEDMDDYY